VIFASREITELKISLLVLVIVRKDSSKNQLEIYYVNNATFTKIFVFLLVQRALF